MSSKRKQVSQAEREAERKFDKRADFLYFEGFPILVKGFVAILAVAIAYFAATMGNDVLVVDLKDADKLKEILTSGFSWLVFCRKGLDDPLPVGIQINTKSLGITKVAVMDCNKPLPQSGMTVVQKYKLNTKKSPLAFLSVGGTHTQIEPILLTKEDEVLSHFVKKNVAKRFSIVDMTSASKVRSYCAKHRCTIWPSSSKFFGPAKAAKFPKWLHVRIPDSLHVGGKQLVSPALVWPTKSGERHFIEVNKDGKLGDDVESALRTFEEDLAFAEQKSTVVEFEWVKEVQRPKTSDDDAERAARKEQARKQREAREAQARASRGQDQDEAHQVAFEKAPSETEDASEDHADDEDTESAGIDLDFD